MSWAEFEIRYGYNAQRAAILQKMKAWLAHMKASHCRTVYIDGSFVCDAAAPGDYDACWDATGVDPAVLDNTLLDQTEEGRNLIKQRFGGDIRPDLECPPGSMRPYLRFFQRDRNGNAKGIVKIVLKDFIP